MKVYITDHGDPSVGIFSITYELDTPIDTDSDVDDRNWFRKQLQNLYQNFAEGRLLISFEDEIRAEIDYMNHVGI